VPDLGKPEILILLIVILVLFGAKRLPGAARSLGQSMRIFKAETKGLRNDEDTTVPPVVGQQALPTTAAAPGVTPAPPAAQDQHAPPLQQ
jgi:sec-independent protein translocase protein TatA